MVLRGLRAARRPQARRQRECSWHRKQTFTGLSGTWATQGAAELHRLGCSNTRRPCTQSRSQGKFLPLSLYGSSSRLCRWSLDGLRPPVPRDVAIAQAGPQMSFPLEPTMSNRIGVHRHVATVHQSFCCYYCQSPIWEQDLSAFVAQHSITRRQALLLRSTAEHLRPLSEGGPNSRANIVAVCLHCNKTRHKAHRPLVSDAYRSRVQRRAASGRWLTSGLFTNSTNKRLG
jgi:HNH endonuclease